MHAHDLIMHFPSGHGFVGTSPALTNALALIRCFAASRAPLLLVGETGTGKEIAAHAAHHLSRRCDGPFIPINCGALPDTLIESEIFGHAKGAFTDASRNRAGLVREAEGGTLFLDEIETLSPRGQVILLRFLQDSSFRAIGDEQRRFADVRVISATNVDLHWLTEKGEFRVDLLFRLNVLQVELPPLRARVDDIALLVPHLLAKAARLEGGAQKTVSSTAMQLLSSYSWPGNVRELEHAMLRAHLLSPGLIIDTEDILRCSAAGADAQAGRPRIDGNHLRAEKARAVHEVERHFVEQALARTNGNISEAARMCNMQRAALSKLAKKYRTNA